MGGRSLKPVWLQGFGQIELANVDGEHPVPVPERGGGLERFEQGGVHIPKGLWVELVARLAHRGGRDGRGLVQGNLIGLTLAPELRYGDGIALPVGRDHQAIDKEQDQQAVDRPSSGLPSGVIVRGHAGGGGDQRLPGTGDGVINLRTASEVIACALRGRRAGCRPQNLLKIGCQRFPVDVLSGLARPVLGGPDALPARRLVGTALKAGDIDKGLNQDRTTLVLLLPVIGQLPRRQAQRRRGQVGHPHPVEDDEPRIDHHQMPCLVLLRVAPADPLVPAAQVAGHRLEQETPQDPLLSVPDERLHLAAERVLVAQVVMRVDRRVPDLRLLRTLDPLERDWLKIRQRRGHRRLLDRKAQIHRIQAGRPYRHTIHRQGQDSERLQHP